jgi:hypothetical protein
MTDLRLITHLASLEGLAGPMEHELRGALNPIGLTLELLEHSLEQADPALRTKQQEYLVRLKAALALYKSQLDALFTALRARPGEEGRFDWCLDVARLGIALEAFAKRRRAVVKVVLPNHPIFVPGDSGRTAQAVLAAGIWAIETAAIAAIEAAEVTGAAAPQRATVTLAMEAGPSSATLSIVFPATENARPRGDSEPDALRVARDAVQRHDGRFQASASDGDMRLEFELPLERKRT